MPTKTEQTQETQRQRTEAAIRRVLDNAPPLSAETKAKLALLLAP